MPRRQILSESERADLLFDERKTPTPLGSEM